MALLLINPISIQKVDLKTGALQGNPIPLSGGIRELANSPIPGKALGLGIDHELYEIDAATGTCTAISSAAMPGVSDGGLALEPSGNTLRYLNDSNAHSYSLDIATGTVAGQDLDVAYVAGDPNSGNAITTSAAAYSTGASPNLYGFDGLNDDIFFFIDVHEGQVQTIGSFGSALAGGCGMAYDPEDHKLYIDCDTGAAAGLYRVDPTTAASVQIGGSELASQGIAILK